MLASNEKAYLAVGAERITLWTRRIANNEMSGDLDVSLSQLPDTAIIWRAVVRPGTLSPTAGGRTVTIPRTAGTLDAFRALLKGCAPP